MSKIISPYGEILKNVRRNLYARDIFFAIEIIEGGK